MSQKPEAVAQTYGVERWGEGYFGINAAGHATLRPDPLNAQQVDLFRLAEQISRSGLRLPVLVRFNDLLRHRVQALCTAFADVARTLDYTGGYRAIYPIKVNQQRSVVEQIVAGGGGGVGLEAGSKPELMAVLASAPAGAAIVCNGYKDREYIRLALIAKRLGHDVYIVIEKPGELDFVLAESDQLGIEPTLGVRVRLAAVASGKWQNSGGAKSKFGLSASQLLDFINRLRAADALGWLVMLHSHIGSQIPDLRDIHQGVKEVARLYVELRRLAAPIRVVDVGGGLGVDYEGSRSPHDYSMNYDLSAYAAAVLRPLARACEAQALPQPMVFSESGRAITAHHAMLITEVVDCEAADPSPPVVDASDDELLQRLSALLGGEPASNGLPQRLQRARLYLDEAHERFSQGSFALAQRAAAEGLFFAVAREVRSGLRLASRRHRELIDELDDLLADRVFCNFSLFQSLPDVWAIDQVFPVMPLHRLNEAPQRVARIHDLTCDSDGCIAQYVDQDGIESALPIHDLKAGESYLLGVFLVGAYQEILGDMHNLFGDTDAVNVTVVDDGRCLLSKPERGDSVDALLRYVHFDPGEMQAVYRQKIIDQDIEPAQAARFENILMAGLHGYTYLKSS